jgi:hypothetical protein
MTITSSPVTRNEKEVKTKYPIVKGGTAGTTKQTGTQMNLVATQGSNVLKSSRVGI